MAELEDKKMYEEALKSVYQKSAVVSEKLSVCEGKLIERKDELKKSGPSLKKELNAFTKNCRELLREIRWYEENGKSEKWKKENLPEFRNKLKNYIKMATEMEKENFIKKYGVSREKILNFNTCQYLREEMRKREDHLRLTYRSPRDRHELVEDYERLLDDSSSEIDETLKVLANDKNVKDYDTYYKQTIETLSGFNKELVGLKKFFDDTKKALNGNDEEIRARIEKSNQDFNKKFDSIDKKFISSGLLERTLSYVGGGLKKIYSYFF